MSNRTDNELTIDELARETGMTVRNIRAHQSRGLLPPPSVRARTGYYGPEHVARVQLIRELQGEGFNLESIRRLIEGSNGSTGQVLDFTRKLREPFEDEKPEVVTVAQLADSFGAEGNPKHLEKAIEIGLLRDLGDNTFEQPSPRLAAVGSELRDLGISTDTTLQTAAKLRRNAEHVARDYVRLFLEEVWRPFEEAGRPPEQWPQVREALDRLRPLAAESLAAMFGIVMNEAVDEAFGKELDRSKKPSRKRK
ncbi:MAG: MerR family transcriptional regulator [Thermoleophilaceae bacterium]|nr:MerR family transcriptional regulator [Thermoleophilaceae bacterium]